MIGGRWWTQAWVLAAILGGCSSEQSDPAPEGSGGEPSNECGSGGGRDPNACNDFDSICSFEETCELFGCGEPWSRFDADLCEREPCSVTSECPDGQECMPAPLLGHFGVTSSGIGQCRYDADCECRCSQTADAITMAYCVDPATLSGEECSVSDVECRLAMTYMETYLASFGDDPDVGERLQACAVKLEDHCRN